MKINLLSRIFFCSLMLQSGAYANNQEVSDWTQTVLTNSLTLNYSQLSDNLQAVKPNYTLTAWQAFNSFLGDKIEDVSTQKLILTPKPLQNAQVVNEGDYSGIHFWRVNQAYSIPQLNVILSFSVVVIKATNPPYVIQSLNMTKTPE